MTNNRAAERIYHGGTIVTVDDARPMVEAVAVADGRILAAGSLAEASAFRGPATELVDLAGRTLLPGLIDGHGHIAESVLSWSLPNLAPPPVGEIETIDALIEALRRHIAEREIPEGETVAGRGYDDSLLAERRHPTAADLDRVSTRHPVVVVHTSGHLAAANTAALRAAGFVKGVADPPSGVIRRDPATGEPTGVVEEHAAIALRALFPRVPVEARLDELIAVQRHYAACGITTAQDGISSPFAFKLLRTAAEQDALILDVVSYPRWTEAESLLAAEIPVGRYQGRLKVGGVKISQDGSPQGKTAYLSRPYHRPPPGQPAEYRGYPILPQAELDGWYDRFFARGWQVICHTNGDAASEMMLDAVERAVAKHGAGDRRPVMIHAQTVREDQLDRIVALGVIPSFFVSHTYYWGDWHINETLGEERAFRISPCASALRRGIRFNIHNDAPVVPPAILPLIWSAVNRVSRSGVVVGPEQRISPLAALKAVTIDAANAYFEEDRKGSIAPGKLADLVILSENPLTVDPMRIREIRVLETIKEGQVIYSADRNGAGRKP